MPDRIHTDQSTSGRSSKGASPSSFANHPNGIQNLPDNLKRESNSFNLNERSSSKSLYCSIANSLAKSVDFGDEAGRSRPPTVTRGGGPLSSPAGSRLEIIAESLPLAEKCLAGARSDSSHQELLTYSRPPTSRAVHRQQQRRPDPSLTVCDELHSRAKKRNCAHQMDDESRPRQAASVCKRRLADENERPIEQRHNNHHHQTDSSPNFRHQNEHRPSLMSGQHPGQHLCGHKHQPLGGGNANSPGRTPMQLRRHKPSCALHQASLQQVARCQHNWNQQQVDTSGQLYQMSPVCYQQNLRPKHQQHTQAAGLELDQGAEGLEEPKSGCAPDSPVAKSALVGSTLLKREISRQLDDWHKRRLQRERRADGQVSRLRAQMELQLKLERKAKQPAQNSPRPASESNTSKFVSQLYFLIHLSAIISLLLHHKNLVSSERKLALQQKAKRSVSTSDLHSKIGEFFPSQFAPFSRVLHNECLQAR